VKTSVLHNILVETNLSEQRGKRLGIISGPEDAAAADAGSC